MASYIFDKKEYFAVQLQNDVDAQVKNGDWLIIDISSGVKSYAEKIFFDKNFVQKFPRMVDYNVQQEDMRAESESNHSGT